MAPASPPDRAAALLAGFRHAVEVATPIARTLAAAIGRGLRSLGRHGWQHRALLAALAQRVMWWSALVLLVIGGRPVLDHTALPERTEMLAPFVVGLLLCAALRLVASARHLRTSALWLGALHGVAVALVWTAFAS